MAGSTGKMTSEAIATRGPRMRLLGVYSGVNRVGFVIMREPDSPIGLAISHIKDPSYRTFARSYSLSYLVRIGKSQIAFDEQLRRVS